MLVWWVLQSPLASLHTWGRCGLYRCSSTSSFVAMSFPDLLSPRRFDRYWKGFFVKSVLSFSCLLLSLLWYLDCYKVLMRSLRCHGCSSMLVSLPPLLGEKLSSASAGHLLGLLSPSDVGFLLAWCLSGISFLSKAVSPYTPDHCLSNLSSGILRCFTFFCDPKLAHLIQVVKGLMISWQVESDVLTLE